MVLLASLLPALTVMSSQMEIEFLGRLSHPNLTKLLGFCREDENLALVYEFMPKGGLNNRLFRNGSTAHFPWEVHLKIVVGAARGLAFLHGSERKLIHMDFKTSYILLDESYTAKHADFGLVTSGPPEGMPHVSTQVIGTRGYAAPEYLATVEWARALLCSKEKLKTIMDSRLKDNYPMDSSFQVALLTLKCLQKTPRERPSITEVVEELESAEAASA